MNQPDVVMNDVGYDNANEQREKVMRLNSLLK